ncbi:MAG: hypothetical protein F4Z71_04095 [Gammaproteobacteria bacterium]|nr:hypothetical protein [Gammaproteobacteria bacterium]MYE28893.1 hypothetical protein [Gammaproteobacteria bacterium]
MLYSVDTQKYISHIPYKSDFDNWCSRLSEEQISSIRSELQSMISENEIHTSSWMPGSNWEGTPWEPIYTHACDQDFNAAALCFGLFVWEAFLNHTEVWSFGKYYLNKEQIRGMTYFRVHPKSKV